MVLPSTSETLVDVEVFKTQSTMSGISKGALDQSACRMVVSCVSLGDANAYISDLSVSDFL